MRLKIVWFLLITTSCFTAPAFAGFIDINGACSFGSCSPDADYLPYGQSFSAPFTLFYTFADSDKYEIAGSFFSMNNGPRPAVDQFSANPVVTYLGNSTGTVSGRDNLQVNFLQDYQGQSGTYLYDGYFQVSGTFGGSLGSGSEIKSAALSSNAGTGSGPLGPFTAPGNFSDSVSGYRRGFQDFTLQNIGFMLSFAPGSAAGSSITIDAANVAAVTPPSPTTTPEPSTWSLAVVAIVCLGGRYVHKSARRIAMH